MYLFLFFPSFAESRPASPSRTTGAGRPADRLRYLLFFLTAICCCSIAQAEPLPVGTSRQTLALSAGDIEIVAYKPVNYAGGPLLVSFHGLSRNIDAYLEATQVIADRNGMLLIIPVFDRQRFPYWRYQALGITRASRRVTTGPISVEPPETWTSTLILGMIERIRNAEGRPDLDYYLIGHSAGAQIANRFSAFVSNNARRIVIANPSSYVLPTRQARFPYGFGDLPADMGDDTALRRYLAQPLTIFLGSADLLAKDLDMLPAAMAQGVTRYQRGLNSFRMAQALAREKDWAFNWRLVEVPGAGHDVRRMYGSSQASAALLEQ